MAKNKITKLKQSALLRELVGHKAEVKAAQERLVQAKEEGDLSENSGYDAAKATIDIHASSIDEITKILENSEVVGMTSGPIIDVGSFIRLEQKDPTTGNFGEPELYMVDSAYDFGVIATDCALGKAILGNPSNVVTIQTAMGDSITYRITKDNSEEALKEFLVLNPPERKLFSGVNNE